MRKIVTSLRAHQCSLVLATGLLAGLVFTTGCGSDQANQEQAATPQAQPPCAVRVDTGALDRFLDLADRVSGGQEVPLTEFSHFAAEPTLDRWRRSFQPENLTASWLGRMMFIALRGQDQLPERYQRKSVQMELVRAFEVSADVRDEIRATAAAIGEGDLLCRVMEELEPWLPASALPESLQVDLLVGYPEIRLLNGRLMLDGSLAWAAGREQLPRFIASILYKDLASLDGQDPGHAKGDAILLESLRLIHNLVAPAMIEHMEQIVFDRRHPMLGGSMPTPAEICDQAHRTLEALDPNLTRVRGMSATVDDDWALLYRLFVGAQSWHATAWYLGTIIDERLGHERLRQAVHHPADLLAAYHEAVAARDGGTQAPPGTYRWYLDSPPAFSVENQRWLDQRLRAYFSG